MASSHFEEIRITGIITERITEPRNDGTEGSALYSIPFSLSRRPDAEWSRLFSQKWDRPAQFTTMHRPGIARVHGDAIVLNGTTIEEIENIHHKTLQSVVAETNRAYGELRGQQDELRAREETATQEHRKRVEEIAKRLTFD